MKEKCERDLGFPKYLRSMDYHRMDNKIFNANIGKLIKAKCDHQTKSFEILHIRT